MKNMRMSKKMKSLISRKINFTKMKPISKVSPYIFITMNALVSMSSISMLMLPSEKNIMKENKNKSLNMILVIALSFVKLFVTLV
jgi:hypothetical protein